ncbi:growth arrest-specific protein 8 [Austrofundulus limnaeus]|uniref:Dynein regulatory complex subunit 4 n=1 Tax=Austrofundulus limnaeus TaxID=52670 RepID=A0A2I4CUI7_AUSLI|nr:PREDICTED: growth arrest-specific protein 8-like [Austrofundulus limnaeus]
MPPKKKDTSKQTAAAKPPTLINGFTKEEISKEQMEEHIVHLQEELDREREERSYFQLEEDMIRVFREITERKLDEARAKLKNLERAAEEDDGCHRVENMVYKQKMKHLLCEHQNTVSELKADRLAAAAALQKEHEELEDELFNKMRAITVDMQRLGSENQIRELELKHKEETAATRANFDKLLAETTARCKEKMQQLQEEQETIKRSVISTQELQWSSHMMALTEDHNQFFRDAKAVVLNVMQNAEAIDQLNEEIAELKVKLKKMKQDQSSVLKENLHLTELLAKVRMEIADVEKKTKRGSVKEIKIPKRKVLEDLKTDHEVLKHHFTKLQLERDELFESFRQNTQTAQDETDLRNSLLESKLQTWVDGLEKIQAQLQSVLTAPNVDHTALMGITTKVKENLESKNSTIKVLEHKRNLISKARKNLLLTAELKQMAPSSYPG